jgi:hypothetical protein
VDLTLLLLVTLLPVGALALALLTLWPREEEIVVAVSGFVVTRN